MAATATVAPATASARGTHGPHDHNPPADLSGLAAPTAKPITFPDPAPEDDPLPGWMVLFITGACALGGWLVLGGIAWLIVTSTDLQPLISFWARVVS